MSDVSWGDMDGFVDRTSADRRSLHQALIEISSSSGGFFSAEWPSMESAAGVWQPHVFTDAYLLIPSPRERDSHAGDSQGEGNMIHRGKREGVCHGGCGSSSQGLRGRANTRAGEAV